jgi:hypothetical protein
VRQEEGGEADHISQRIVVTKVPTRMEGEGEKLMQK